MITPKPLNVKRTFVGNKIVDNSDVAGAPATSSFSTQYLVSMDFAKASARRDERRLSSEIWCACTKGLAVVNIGSGSVL